MSPKVGCNKKNSATQIKAITVDGDARLGDFERVMRHSLSIVLSELRRRITGRLTAELPNVVKNYGEASNKTIGQQH